MNPFIQKIRNLPRAIIIVVVVVLCAVAPSMAAAGSRGYNLAFVDISSKPWADEIGRAHV